MTNEHSGRKIDRSMSALRSILVDVTARTTDVLGYNAAAGIRRANKVSEHYACSVSRSQGKVRAIFFSFLHARAPIVVNLDKIPVSRTSTVRFELSSLDTYIITGIERAN